MAKELRGITATGRTIYFHIRNSSGQLWNGTTFETYTSGNYSNYDIAGAEDGTSGVYTANFPTAITTAGDYEYFIYRQAGASPAEGDQVVGSGSLNWNGSTVTSDNGNVDTTLALVSLADVKEYLKVTGTTENSIISFLINEISAATNNYCQRYLLQKTHTEYYNGRSNSREIILKNYPIISVTSLHDDVNRDFTSSSEIDVTTNVIIQKEMGVIKIWNQFVGFNRADANIKIVYSAGYALANVPKDLQLAVKKWIAYHYFKYNTKAHVIQSESIGDLTTSFLNEEMSKEVEGILQKYMNLTGAPDFAYAD